MDDRAARRNVKLISQPERRRHLPCRARRGNTRGIATAVESDSVLPQYLPMAPTLVREPFHRPGWVFEEKVDGWRMLAYKDSQRVRLVSRNGVDHTRRFSDLAAKVAKLSARTLVLDGEVAIYDHNYVPASTDSAILTRMPSPHRPCSWPSTSSTGMAETSACVHCGTVVHGWTTLWPAMTSYSPCGASRRMD